MCVWVGGWGVLITFKHVHTGTPDKSVGPFKFVCPRRGHFTSFCVVECKYLRMGRWGGGHADHLLAYARENWGGLLSAHREA